MSDLRVISTAAELEKLQAKFNEAVSEDGSIIDDANPIEKARFQTRMAKALDELRAAEKVPGVMSSPSAVMAQQTSFVAAVALCL